MTDETDPRAPVDQPEPSGTPDPADATAGPAATGPSAAALPSLNTAQVTAFWTGLGSVGQLIVAAALALIAITMVGAIIDAWDSSGTLAIVVVTAAVAAGLAAWLTARVRAGALLTPIPLETIEFAAGVVAVVLAVLRLVEFVFDFDDLEDYGGPIGAVLTVGLALAAGALLLGALRRDPTLRSAALAGDRGTRLAVGGLVLVLIAWLLNLSIGFWNMNAASTSVAILAFAAVLVVVQPRWLPVVDEIPLGWLGAGLGVVALLLAVGQWGELMDIGLTRVDLELIDYVPQVLSFLGIVAIIAGGVLAGMPTWQARLRAQAPVVATPPTTPPTPLAAPSAGPAAAPEPTAAPTTPAPPATPGEPPETTG